MASINHVVLTGRLVADPEIKSTGSGMTVAVFRMAVNDYYKEEQKSYFFDLKAFGKTAEVIRDYCKKGRLLAIDGKLTQETWETKEKEKRSKIVILVNTLDLTVGGSGGGGKKGEESTSTKENYKDNFSSKSNNSFDDNYIESDLPF